MLRAFSTEIRFARAKTRYAERLSLASQNAGEKFYWMTCSMYFSSRLCYMQDRRALARQQYDIGVGLLKDARQQGGSPAGNPELQIRMWQLAKEMNNLCNWLSNP